MNEQLKEDAITQIVTDCAKLQQRGQDWDREKICSDNPELLPELDHQLRALELMRAIQNDPMETIARTPGGVIDVTMTAPLMSRPAIQRELRPEETFGSFKIIRKLGQGGMGTVYEADDLESGRRIALKTLSHQFDSPEAKERFLREGKLAASINHPNSVYVYGADEIDGFPIIVMELLRGGTLQDQLDRDGQFSVHDAVKAILDLIAGLEAAAEKGILHRDIKPANCFVDIDGTVKIGDYGLSISSEARIDPVANKVTQPGVIVGTPAFASPEQLRGEELDIRSDIYSVGATLYYLLTGKPPFGSDRQNLVQFIASVLESPRPDIQTVRSDVPSELTKILKRSLGKSKNERIQDYQKLRSVLLQVADYDPPARLLPRFLAGWTDAVCLYWPLMLVPSVAARLGMEINTHVWTIVVLLYGTLYYAVPEHFIGCTIGKWTQQLRVIAIGGGRTSFGKNLKRATYYFAIPMAIVYGVAALLSWTPLGPTPEETATLQQSGSASYGSGNETPAISHSIYVKQLVSVGIGNAIHLAAFIVLFWSARNSRQNLALHDSWSDTKVVSIRGRNRAVANLKLDSEGPIVRDTNFRKIGPFEITGQISTVNDDRLLIGFDPRLNRKVWIQTSDEQFSLPEVRKALSRAGRVRWIASGVEKGVAWAAFEAPHGALMCKSLPKLRKTRLALAGPPYDRVVADLRAELNESAKDGTVPETLCFSQLWLGNDGCVRLLDWPLEIEDRSSEHCERMDDTAEGFLEKVNARFAAVSQLARVKLLLFRYSAQVLIGLGITVPMMAKYGILSSMVIGTIFSFWIWLLAVWFPAVIATACFGSTYVMWRMGLVIKKGDRNASRLARLARLIIPAIYYGGGMALFFVATVAVGESFDEPGPSIGLLSLLWLVFFVVPLAVNLYLPPGEGLVDRLLGTRVVPKLRAE